MSQDNLQQILKAGVGLQLCAWNADMLKYLLKINLPQSSSYDVSKHASIRITLLQVTLSSE